MMKKFFTLSLLMYCARICAGQDYASDAVRMMQTDLKGSARSLGIGDALSSVGDMSSLASNPAGIAIYNRHELSVSAGALLGNSKADYSSNQSQKLSTSSASYTRPSFSQAGLILAGRQLSNANGFKVRYKKGILNRVVFGISYQKLVSFERQDHFSGLNTNNSYAYAMASSFNKNPVDINLNNFSIPEVNAYNSKLFERTGSSGQELVPKISVPVSQSATLTTKGALNEMNIALGFNLSNTIFVGVGIGIPHMSYSKSLSFHENSLSSNTNYTSDYGYSYTGWGVNGKLGVIIKPAKWIRIGASVQSPTFFHFKQSINGTTVNYNDTMALTWSNSLLYNLTYIDPIKGNFGLSFYVRQWMLIAIDYQLDDYGHTRYESGLNEKGNTINNQISESYKLTSSLKAGVEIYIKRLCLRGGFAWSQSPFTKDNETINYDTDRFSYTAGLGYVGKSLFIDVAYARTQYRNYYTPYSYQLGSAKEQTSVSTTFSSNAIIATLGLKFGKAKN